MKPIGLPDLHSRTTTATAGTPGCMEEILAHDIRHWLWKIKRGRKIKRLDCDDAQQ